jgi:hypothetical protein
MATEQDLRTEIDSLRQLIEADQVDDQSVVNQLTALRDQLAARVKDLETQLAAAGQTSPVDFADLIASIESIKTDIRPVVAAAPTDPQVPSGETPVPTDGTGSTEPPPGIASFTRSSSDA